MITSEDTNAFPSIAQTGVRLFASIDGSALLRFVNGRRRFRCALCSLQREDAEGLQEKDGQEDWGYVFDHDDVEFPAAEFVAAVGDFVDDHLWSYDPAYKDAGEQCD